MTSRALVLLILAFLAGGCACCGAQSVSEPSDENWQDAQRTETYTASVDELDLQLAHTLELAAEADTEPDCEQVCGLSFQICDLSDRICEIAERHPDWDTTAYQCHDSRERCDVADEDTAAVCDCTEFEFESSVRI